MGGIFLGIGIMGALGTSYCGMFTQNALLASDRLSAAARLVWLLDCPRVVHISDPTLGNDGWDAVLMALGLEVSIGFEIADTTQSILITTSPQSLYYACNLVGVIDAFLSENKPVFCILTDLNAPIKKEEYCDARQIFCEAGLSFVSLDSGGVERVRTKFLATNTRHRL
jgi:hypothetical protein